MITCKGIETLLNAPSTCILLLLLLSLFCELSELLHEKTPHFKLEAWNGSLMEWRVIIIILSYMILQ